MSTHTPTHSEPTPEILAALARPERRAEGPLKVTGRALYSADLRPPGLLHARFANSTVPHARIVSIDTARAKALPGVHAVLTGAEIGPRRFGRRLFDWPALAYERVRFVGEHVAAVAAESPQIADEAARLIEIEYDELPPVPTPAAALALDAPLVHDPAEAAEYFYLGGDRPPVPHPNLQSHAVRRLGSEAELAAAFARAHRVFEHTFTTPRQHQGHLEPHVALVWTGDDGVVHVVSSNKGPFPLRQQLARVTGLPQDQIVVDNAFIGGDFGGKGTSIDEFACYFLARATGRPVLSVMSGVDEFQSANPRHAATFRLRSGVDEQGRFVAHEAEVVFDGGAYAAGKPSPLLIPAGGFATLSPYRVPNVLLDVKVVYTTTVPGGHMRAPGEVQAAFAGESHVDMIAAELGIDPIDFRLRNAVRPGDVGAAGDRAREPRAVEVLDALRRELRWDEHRPTVAGRGRGIALGVRHVGGGKTSVTYRLLDDGRVEVVSGVPDQGSGGHTVARRVAAAVLSVDLEHVVVRYGSTAEAPVDPGAGGSRVTHIVGQAAAAGATTLKQRLEELASEVMGWPAGQVRLEAGRFVVGDGSGESAPFREVAARIARTGSIELRGDYDEGEHGHDEPGDYNFAAYGAEVEVDPETGQVRVLEAVLAVDVGTIINPIAHQGQLDGGFIYGFGNAVMEELPIDDGRVGVLSLGEYKLPTAPDVPPLRTVLVPTSVGPGPFGAKMAGEVSNTGVAPAIANAVAAAVGARVTAMPITAERVRAALRTRGEDR